MLKEEYSWHPVSYPHVPTCHRKFFESEKLEDIDHYLHGLCYLFPEDGALFTNSTSDLSWDKGEQMIQQNNSFSSDGEKTDRTPQVTKGGSQAVFQGVRFFLIQN